MAPMSELACVPPPGGGGGVVNGVNGLLSFTRADDDADSLASSLLIGRTALFRTSTTCSSSCSCSYLKSRNHGKTTPRREIAVRVAVDNEHVTRPVDVLASFAREPWNVAIRAKSDAVRPGGVKPHKESLLPAPRVEGRGNFHEGEISGTWHTTNTSENKSDANFASVTATTPLPLDSLFPTIDAHAIGTWRRIGRVFTRLSARAHVVPPDDESDSEDSNSDASSNVSSGSSASTSSTNSRAGIALPQAAGALACHAVVPFRGNCDNAVPPHSQSFAAEMDMECVVSTSEPRPSLSPLQAKLRLGRSMCVNVRSGKGLLMDARLNVPFHKLEIGVPLLAIGRSHSSASLAMTICRHVRVEMTRLKNNRASIKLSKGHWNLNAKPNLLELRRKLVRQCSPRCELQASFRRMKDHRHVLSCLAGITVQV